MSGQENPRTPTELLRGFEGYKVDWHSNFSIDITQFLPGGIERFAQLKPDQTAKPLPSLNVITLLGKAPLMPRAKNIMPEGVQYTFHVIQAEQPHLTMTAVNARDEITLEETVSFLSRGIQLLGHINRVSKFERDLVRRSGEVQIYRQSPKRNNVYRDALDALNIPLREGDDPYLRYLQAVLEMHIT